MSIARYIMIGGFLGAGKTTSINKLAATLTADGKRVGLITNDQGMGLTDTALARAGDYPVEEITGGCFCCRFGSLVDAARNLREATRPDVFLAEPVGSCTDLAATVALPLSHLYGDQFCMSPLSVVMDPLRARAVLGLDPAKKFSRNVTYIYRKQLEEAECLVINKTDLVTPPQLAELQDALTREFPMAKQFPISARSGSGLPPWFEALMTQEMNVRRVMEVDYALYGDGEARLGWLNAEISLSADFEWDGNALLKSLAHALRDAARAADSEIAHLKMTLTPPGDPMTLAAANLVSTAREAELSHLLPDPIEEGTLLLNLRAEADPETLHQALQHALRETAQQQLGLRVEVVHTAHFRPGQPEPTHRYASVGSGSTAQ